MDTKRLFEILVREHAGMLDVFLKSAVRDPGLADDLFQETVLTAWNRLDDFDQERPFGPWLRGIARRKVLAAHRKSASAVALTDPGALEALEEQCARLHHRPGDTLDEKLDGVRRCIEDLAEPYRDAVRARYEEDLDGARLAERLSTNNERAKKLVQRARRLLAACIERTGGTEVTA
ncbi:MAG: sigma-70 family RNA polymerase sigma factor [Planctomycetota bacterium]